MKHEQILKSNWLCAQDALIDYSQDYSEGEVIFFDENVSAKHLPLLQIAPIMYSGLNSQAECLRQLIETCKLDENLKPLQGRFEQMLSPIELTMRIAQTGIREYVKESKQ